MLKMMLNTLEVFNEINSMSKPSCIKLKFVCPKCKKENNQESTKMPKRLVCSYCNHSVTVETKKQG